MLYTQYYIEGIKNVSKFLDKFQESVPHTKTRNNALKIGRHNFTLVCLFLPLFY